ncbi:family 16 glycoside hydrolase [Rheinheimera sp.]|uniref:family 16 glycoside hydrolase n=1 Tax=Rheinheimera sp. TaxID=1869214 RepID=UPI00307D6F1F
MGEHGKEYWRSWMLSQEFQIMQGHTGDYWSQASSAIDIRAFLPESIMNAVADERQPFLAVGAGEKNQGFVLRKDNHELPDGQWNTLELICFEGQSLHIVNGQVVMVLRNSRYRDEQGQVQPLVQGKLQLQSEAAEVFYRRIQLKSLSRLPARYQALFSEG